MAYPIPSAGKELLRAILESAGISRYSRPGKYGLDLILQQYLPPQGVFLEVGAMNGFYASNTYYLEKFCGWTGILVEPVPRFFRECVKRRRRSRVFNCALVPNGWSQPTINMVFAGDMSVVKGPMGSDREGCERQCGAGPNEFEVPARTLTSVLEEAHASRLDFFSLDVEGYEIPVLNGLDMERFQPGWLLVECLTPASREDMASYLTARKYELVAQVTPRDLLWRSRCQCNP